MHGQGELLTLELRNQTDADSSSDRRMGPDEVMKTANSSPGLTTAGLDHI